VVVGKDVAVETVVHRCPLRRAEMLSRKTLAQRSWHSLFRGSIYFGIANRTHGTLHQVSGDRGEGKTRVVSRLYT
jgi:hypothetical protein